MSHPYTAEQIEAAIPQAIRERRFTVVISLLNMLAAEEPHRARALLNSIHAALELAKAADR